MGLFDVPFTGNVATFALGAALFLLVTLGMGVLISTVSQNQGQAIQLAFMIMLPQVLLSGLIFPVASMAAGVRWISYVLPLTYFIQISRGVMLKATPISALWQPLGLLAAARRRRARPGDRPVPPRPGPERPGPRRRPGRRGRAIAGSRSPHDLGPATTCGSASAARIALDGGDRAGRPVQRSRSSSAATEPGKSTCLRTLVGLVRPQGRDRCAARPRSASGTCPPPPGCTPTSPCRRTSTSAAGAYRLPAGPARSREPRCSSAPAWPGSADRLGGQLSGGMQRKLAVGAGAAARAGPAGARRADHRGRPGEPGRAVAAHLRRRRAGHGRRRGHDVRERGRPGRVRGAARGREGRWPAARPTRSCAACPAWSAPCRAAARPPGPAVLAARRRLAGVGTRRRAARGRRAGPSPTSTTPWSSPRWPPRRDGSAVDVLAEARQV